MKQYESKKKQKSKRQKHSFGRLTRYQLRPESNSPNLHSNNLNQRLQVNSKLEPTCLGNLLLIIFYNASLVIGQIMDLFFEYEHQKATSLATTKTVFEIQPGQGDQDENFTSMLQGTSPVHTERNSFSPSSTYSNDSFVNY